MFEPFGKGKGYSSLWKHLTAVGNIVPYGSTQCHLPSNSGDFPAITTAEADTRFSDPGEIKAELI